MKTSFQEPSGLFKTDGGKTKSNAIEVPSISLPQGGGAIKSMDEKFTVNAVSGTASFGIPLPVGAARALAPNLTLTYNSGGGNGVFGLGWQVGLPSIKRKTAKALPQYLDAVDSDIFLFGEAEDLVPKFKKENDGSFSLDPNGDYIIHETDSSDGLFNIRYYIPRIEGAFFRIERWSGKNSDETKWKVTSRENITTLLGWSANARIADPDNENRVFEWLPEFVFDDKGNCAHYLYKAEDAIGFDDTLPHNRNRFKNGKITYTNRYVEKIGYGNKTPYKNMGDAFPGFDDYLFSTVFDYGEYNTDSPYDKTSEWTFRPDAFSDYRAGFEIRNTRLCRRVLLFHHFNGAGEYNGLVKSANFEYDTSIEQDFTFLKSVTRYGYIKKDDGTYTHKSFPSTDFEYQKHHWNPGVKTIDADNVVHAPVGIDDKQYLFTDLYNEGLSGILTEQANGWYYKANQGNGTFEAARLVTPKPSFAGLGNTLLLSDLDADGGKQLINYHNEPKGFFEQNDDNEWLGYQVFDRFPNINLKEAKMIDLNGDGMPEAVIAEENVFTWYPSQGRKGFAPAKHTGKPFDEEAGPHLVFEDEVQSIFLADMSGDGLTDLVRIKNSEVCYWPNMGYGKFGAKVTLDQPPLFDHPDAFSPTYIRLADIDGSGTTDIIYLGENKFTCWKNLSGNRFAAVPFEVDSFPEIHSQANVNVVDLLGNGVACIVWSSALSKDAHAPLRYIDLMDSKKPHLMLSYKNNMGKEVSLEYTPSTKFYIDDKLAGNPWITKLHFPVHCISKTETVDKISGHRTVTSYVYHHGYYDHAEKEFRGFGRVDQTDSETFEHWKKGNASNIVEEPLHQEPVMTKTWNHTGAFLRQDTILGQYAHEYWYEEMARQGFAVTHPEVPLPDARLVTAPGIDPTLPDRLSAQEWREAARACKSMSLRIESFAKDAAKFGNTEEARKQELTPYTAATHSCLIELLQPKGKNQHAVFVIKESEAITYTYERNPADARVAHLLNIQLDEYGNVLESAAVVYPRLAPDASLAAETQQSQNQTVIVYTRNQYTNDVISNEAYCLRRPSETETFDLKGVAKTGSFYRPADFEDILSAPRSDTAHYHETDKPLAPSKAQKRLVEHVRFTYYRHLLNGALPLHTLETPVLPHENYQLAYTTELLNDIFGGRVDATMLVDGKFVHSEGDDQWWIPSGRALFTQGAETHLDAQNRFYVPVAYVDPYLATTQIRYYGSSFLLIQETEDALGNKSRVDTFNFRTLSPKRMKDINGNMAETLMDELGMVKATAKMGKGSEADDLTGLTEYTEAAENTLINNFFQAADSGQLTAFGKTALQHASTRFVYDLHIYTLTGEPVSVAMIQREEHYQKNNDSPIQIRFEYTDGMGEVAMKKMQAEPGLAKRVTVNPDNSISIDTVDTSTSVPKRLRWVGSGRTVKNNKNNPVKEYEPYFSVTHRYENAKELVETGVTSKLYYDAVSRLIKAEMPDATFSKIVYTSWKQTSYDANDTLLESPWYTNRSNRLIDSELSAEGKDPLKEKQAADKAAKHANTPTVLHLNTLGKPILSIEHNKNVDTDADEFYPTHALVDVEGNLRRVTDARNNPVMRYKYDMLGQLVYQNSMDAGQRWLLMNIAGKPLRTWNERNHMFQFFYDILQRPTHSKVSGGDGAAPLDHIYMRTFYGESRLLPNRSNEAIVQVDNVLGKPIRQYDTGGLLETPDYDFDGHVTTGTRTLFKKYKETPNWTDANLLADLESDAFSTQTEMDALGRIHQQTTPDGSIHTPTYNEAGFLSAQTVLQSGDVTPSIYIKRIDYNEKRQRSKIIYGNDVSNNLYYDKETFRLKRLESKRQNNDPLQDWRYTYDAAGNITHIEDKNIPTRFFDNIKSEGTSEYTYDALYRLAEAKGRENNAALAYTSSDNWNDTAFLQAMNPNDLLSIRSYTQTYRYDSVGNIQMMQHAATGNNWTRNYTYAAGNNRLTGTDVGGQAYAYAAHPTHGFMTQMPHLDIMDWNCKDELAKTARQKRLDGGTPETTYYQYDGQGQRLRKITENEANAGITPTKKNERIYIGPYELYRKHSGGDAGLERVSLSLMDKDHRFAMIETRNTVDDGTEESLVRYQLHNHLGSAALELDAAAQVISYEEYHPFGSTAYQATSTAIRSAAKRYRYTGMERDDETGMGYHGARYYISWLGRWLSPDPLGMTDGPNLYAYVKNNPIKGYDKTGTQTIAPPRASMDPVPRTQQARQLQEDLARTPKELTPLDVPLRERPSTGSDTMDSIQKGFDAVSRWMRNYLPGIIAAPLAGIVELISALVQLIGAIFAQNAKVAERGAKELGYSLLRMAGFRELVEEQWIDGEETARRFGVRDMPTGAKVPESAARDLSITSSRTDTITNHTAGRNGMHAWHASTNAVLAGRMGPIGSVGLFLAGIYHETFDFKSFSGEQYWQGTVNHILDSLMDILANIIGLIIGLLLPRRISLFVAATVGNQIPGPGDPDPAFGGAGHPYGQGPNPNDPRRAWGHYPPPIGQPNGPPPPPRP